MIGDFLFGRIGYYVNEHKESPGKELRNTETNQYGVSFDFRTRGRTYYTGEMYVYHIPSKSMYEIDTKQGDTEIITIDVGRNQLFLRVHDKIYVVPIVDNIPMWEKKSLIYQDRMIAPHIHRVFYSKGEKLLRKYVNSVINKEGCQNN